MIHHHPDHITTVQGYRNVATFIPPSWSEGFVLANGIRHHYYRTGGDRPPVVLLHGFLDGALTWLRTARALEQTYDVIMVDARSHGRSDRVTTSVTTSVTTRATAGHAPEVLVEDTVGLIRSLQLSPVRLLGHSMGGATGIHVAAAYPEMVRALIVEGIGDESEVNTDFASSPGYQAWLGAYVAWLEQLKTQTHGERMISALSQIPPGTPFPPEEEYVTWVDICAHLDLELVRLGAGLWSELATQVRAREQALQQVVCPVLILKSAFFAQPGAPAFLREEASDQSNISIIRFENTGHLIHRDQFDLFITVVQDFFQEH
jgi:pimeloyl-ACP methyl ester carboxylesterase